MKEIGKLIKAEAASLGFSFISFTHAKQPIHYPEFIKWLGDGYAGELDYLKKEKAIHSRGNPASLLDHSKSIIVFGFRYQSQTLDLPQPQSAGQNNPVGLIASYALCEDYHTFVRNKTRLLMVRIIQNTGMDIQYRIFIDSSLVLEKDTAFMAGAGWIGRNSLLITPDYGSFHVIGCLLTNLDLPEGQTFSKDLCGKCQVCVQACPAHCLTDQHTVIAEQCIAYQTIENMGVIPRELRSKIGPWIFGCDICQNSCPWNAKNQKDQPVSSESLPRKIKPKIDLLQEINLTQDEFITKFKGTPVLRATHEGYLRNIIIAMGNSKSLSCISPLKRILEENPSWNLRLHAAWALAEIHTPETETILQQVLQREKDQRVREELTLSLNEKTSMGL
jgi:epoxyqueuosine reductase